MDREGRPPVVPYVVRPRACEGRVVVVGSLHERDPRFPQFAEIERLYRAATPTVVLHENVTPGAAAATRDDAIRRDAELGLLRFLTAADGTRLATGDLPEVEEVRVLRTRADDETLLALLVAQRLPLGAADDTVTASDYPGFVADYLVPAGLPVAESRRAWPGFLEAWRRVTGTSYTRATYDARILDPLRGTGPLARLVREAAAVRDERLLDTIAAEAARGERVLVVFGAWHVLAIEPVLEARLARACRSR